MNAGEPIPAEADESLRRHLVWLLKEGHAHCTFERAVADIPDDLLGARASGIPYTPWRLVEHLRICQWDILEFSRNADHVSPDFPDGHWPATDGPPDTDGWEASLVAFRRDRTAMMDLVEDPQTDLFAPIPHGDGQSILREALLLADHNAYHIGQLVVLRRALGAWPEE